MTGPSPSVGPMALAAKVAKELTLSRRVAYAHIAPDLTVAQTSSSFQAIVDETALPLRGTALGELMWAFVGAEDALAAILRGDAPSFTLERINREGADGEPAYFTYHVTRLIDDQPAAGLLLIVEDVTGSGRLAQELAQDRNELRLLQAELHQANAELRRLNRYKSFVISMAAHDLRSPLTTIRGYADMLLDALSKSDDARREYVLSIALQADRLTRMVANLLDVDQIEHDQLVLHPIACDLTQLVRDAAGSLQAMATLRRIGLSSELPGAPLVVQADPERIEQVLANLISNALKYTPEGGQVTVTARHASPWAVVRVADTGPGMTGDQLAHLFQPYYRTDDARKSDVIGTGLGLYISKTLIDAHRGNIEASSDPGRGTTIEFRLPLGEG